MSNSAEQHKKGNYYDYQFGLENGLLPKHSVQVFKKWQKDNLNFKVFLTNGNKAKKGAFYKV